MSVPPRRRAVSFPPTSHARGHHVGPLAGLLLLLGIVLAGSPAGAFNGAREPTPRMGVARRSSAAAVLQSDCIKANISDEAEDGPSVACYAPQAFTVVAWGRPLSLAPADSKPSLTPSKTISYRARAPPAGRAAPTPLVTTYAANTGRTSSGEHHVSNNISTDADSPPTG
jgi:hypothetical protein